MPAIREPGRGRVNSLLARELKGKERALDPGTQISVTDQDPLRVRRCRPPILLAHWSARRRPPPSPLPAQLVHVMPAHKTSVRAASGGLTFPGQAEEPRLRVVDLFRGLDPPRCI